MQRARGRAHQGVRLAPVDHYRPSYGRRSRGPSRASACSSAPRTRDAYLARRDRQPPLLAGRGRPDRPRRPAPRPGPALGRGRRTPTRPARRGGSTPRPRRWRPRCRPSGGSTTCGRGRCSSGPDGRRPFTIGEAPWKRRLNVPVERQDRRAARSGRPHPQGGRLRAQVRQRGSAPMAAWAYRPGTSVVRTAGRRWPQSNRSKPEPREHWPSDRLERRRSSMAVRLAYQARPSVARKLASRRRRRMEAGVKNRTRRRTGYNGYPHLTKRRGVSDTVGAGFPAIR